MSTDLAEAILALRTSFALDARDWSATDRDAWRYGVIVGWSRDIDDPDDGDALAEIAARHPDIDIARMVRLHNALDAATIPTSPGPPYTHRVIPDPNAGRGPDEDA